MWGEDNGGQNGGDDEEDGEWAEGEHDGCGAEAADQPSGYLSAEPVNFAQRAHGPQTSGNGNGRPHHQVVIHDGLPAELDAEKGGAHGDGGEECNAQAAQAHARPIGGDDGHQRGEGGGIPCVGEQCGGFGMFDIVLNPAEHCHPDAHRRGIKLRCGVVGGDQQI